MLVSFNIVTSEKYLWQCFFIIAKNHQYFYHFLARVDPHLLFVLLSKFDMDKWLQLNKPKLIDISNLIQLILRGMELWNYQNSELLQDLLTCHLIKLFEHNFPEHYGDILQNVLMAFSNKRLKPNVINVCINLKKKTHI